MLLPISEGRNSLKTHIHNTKTNQNNIPIKQIIKTAPNTAQLKSRKPFYKAFKTNFDVQEAWKTHWLEHQTTGGNLITDPTKPIPDFFPTSRKQWSIANRIRSRQTRIAVTSIAGVSLNSPTCPKCIKLLQDLDDFIKNCLLTKLTGGFKSTNECDMNFKNRIETANVKVQSYEDNDEFAYEQPRCVEV